MKKILIVVGILLALLLVLAIFLIIFRPSNTTTGTPNNPVTFPTASSTSTTGTGSAVPQIISVPAQGGQQITTRNFIANGTTIADTENQGSYLLAGSLGYCLPSTPCQAASSTDYNIFYDQNSGTFTVGLLKEPLGAVRHEAEVFLENTLGLSAAQLCSLNYYVGTTYTVNENYDSGNLGFSGCPGATQLPE